MERVIPVKGRAIPTEDFKKQFPRSRKVKVLLIDKLKIIGDGYYIRCRITNLRKRSDWFTIKWFDKIIWK